MDERRIVEILELNREENTMSKNQIMIRRFNAKDENELCGYIRCRDDDGFGVYVYDLLVDKSHRGKEFGRLLMEQVCNDFFGNEVYVLGDNYPYYEKLGYAIEGTIYIVKPKMQ